MGLAKIAVDGLVERELLLDEAERIGLKVSDDEITDQIFDGWIRVSVPAADPQAAYKLRVRDGMIYAGFKDPKTKQFEVKAYERQLRMIVGRSPTEFREEQGREILAGKMRDLITAPIRVSDDEAYQLYEGQKSSASVSTIAVKQSWVARWTPPPASADIDAWIHDPGNGEALEKVASTRDADDLPKADHIRHILIKTPPDPTEDDLRNAASRLAIARARIASGETFAEVARDMSEDKGSAMRGGDVGDKLDGFVGPFRDAASALKPGDMTVAIQTQFGLHLITKDDPSKEAAVKAQMRKDVAREMTTHVMAANETKALTAKLLADVKSGTKPEDAIAKLIASMPKRAAGPAPMDIKREPKEPMDGGADATVTTTAATVKKTPAKPLAADTDPDRPQVNPGQPFNKGGDPVAGLAPANERKLVDFAFSAKDGDWDPDAIDAEDGLLLVRLTDQKLATHDEFDKEKDTFEQSLLGAKRAEALSLHVKRLRDEAKNEFKVDESYLTDGRTADGGAPPADEEDEESP
jgi:peptidyl-prolyl cis-trans isomerase D